MSEMTATHDQHSAHAEHPKDSYYVRIAVILALLTGLEVAMSYIGLEGLALVLPLLVVMAIKFVMVALHFMHLKFDSKLLRNVFYSGLLLAVGVYVVALTTFEVFFN